MCLPGSFLRRVISATTSPSITVVLFQSGSRSVDETTYLVMLLIRALYGSPDRVGHTGAKTSYVRRPIRTASQANSRSVWMVVRLSSSTSIDGQRCGLSTTPSSEMYVELMILRICISLRVAVYGLFTARCRSPDRATCGYRAAHALWPARSAGRVDGRRPGGRGPR